MTRRYRWHDEPVVRRHLFVVPSGETVSVAPGGYTVRLRGDRDGTVVHSYRCPVHGLFDASVRRADVPDVVTCPLWSWSIAGCNEEYDSREAVEDAAQALGADFSEVSFETQACADDSPWAGSLCGIGFAAGEVTG